VLVEPQAVDPEPEPAMGLRIDVEQQDRFPSFSQSSRGIDGGRGLTDTTL